MNLVCMTANLTKDPEVRYTPTGTAVANIGLACNRQYKGKDGEIKKEVCFVNGVAWGKTAENAGQYLHKGSPVFVEGRLSSRTWEDKQGGKRSTIEVQIDRITFLDRSKAESTATTQPQPDPSAELTPEENAWINSPEA